MSLFSKVRSAVRRVKHGVASRVSKTARAKVKRLESRHREHKEKMAARSERHQEVARKASRQRTAITKPSSSKTAKRKHKALKEFASGRDRQASHAQKIIRETKKRAIETVKKARKKTHTERERKHAGLKQLYASKGSTKLWKKRAEHAKAKGEKEQQLRKTFQSALKDASRRKREHRNKHHQPQQQKQSAKGAS